MYARNVSFRLKSNMQSDYTRTFENKVLLFTAQAEGLQGRNHVVESKQPGSGFNQSREHKNNADDYNTNTYPKC